MGTYDVTDLNQTKVLAAGSAMPFDFGKRVGAIKVNLKYSEILAANATLTTNGKITSGDILQVVKVPVTFVALWTVLRAVTPEGSATTVDIGLAGGDEFDDGVDANQAAGAVDMTGIADDYGADNQLGVTFSAADTIDFTAKADIEAGEWVLYVVGIWLD